MRIKNATFIQKHLEKLVLLGSVLFLVVVLAIFVGGVLNPYSVEVGAREYENPADVIPALKDTSNKIEQGLRAGDQIPESYVPPDMETNYREMLEQPVVSVPELRLARSLSQHGTPMTALNMKAPPPAEYVVPSPPMPSNIAIASGHDVLDVKFDPQVNAAFAELWGGPRNPADFHYVIVEGEFSMYEWAQALIGEPGEAGKIPRGIWSTRLFATAVYLIREEYDPQSGQWVNRTYVQPMPGQIQVMPSEVHSDEPERAAQLIEEIERYQEFILNPELPAVVKAGALELPKDKLDPDGFDEFGDEFRGPGLDGQPLSDEDRKRIERRERLEERRRQAQERRRQRDGGDEFGDPGTSDREQRRQRQLEERRRQQQLEEERRRAAAERERQRLEEERRRREEERRFNPGFNNPEFGFGGGGQNSLNLNPEDTTRVWAVDVTTEPGKTYRYKLAVAVINPLYGVPRLDPEQLEKNKNKASLGPSEEVLEQVSWTERVEVPPKYEFFYVGGGETRSRVEIWTIYNGQRIKQEFEVSAGDPIGGTVTRNITGVGETQIDLKVDAIVVDIERRSDLSGRVTYALIYIDKNGVLHERIQSEDQTDPRRRKLGELMKQEEQEINNYQDYQDFDDGFDEF